MPLQALNASGSGTVADVANAFNYAGQHGIRIVNASLSTTATSQTLEQAVADNPNTLYVVAAGNNAANDDDPNTSAYPCDLPEANLICVGATDQNDRPASFTNYGAATVDLFAPGVNILSTWTGGRYAYASGTSMATPMVSGTLALMLAAHPWLTTDQLKDDLLATVSPVPQLAGLSATGGELNAGAAVAAVAPVAPPTAPPATTLPPVAVTQPTPPPPPRVISLSHVAVRGGRGGPGLVFALSARARVQISFTRRARGSVVRTSVTGHRGTNRYGLSWLLHGRRLARGRYALNVRLGGQAVIISLKVV
jgi:subtilisin family serine protease